MKIYLRLCTFLMAMVVLTTTHAQTVDWRLVKDSYSNVDPDGAGPAIGSVVFGLDLRAVGGDVNDITQISTGYSYQSVSAFVPAVPGCTLSSNTPANITVGPVFAGAGFQYTVVQQCNNLVTNTAGHTFDRTAAGTIDNAIVTFNLTTAMGWTRLLTITLYTTGAAPGPEGGYAMIHSGNGGSPGALGSYAVTTSFVNEVVANSLTYASDIPLGSGTLPVLLTNYDVKCTDKGAVLTWSTATEQNSNRFEIQRSENGSDWTVIDAVAAAGNSSVTRNYQYLDLFGGTAFYRVRQLDNDGRATYTGIRQTSCRNNGVYVSLYPVPAKDQMTVSVRSDVSLRTDLQIIDANGKVIRKVNTQINKGNNNIQVMVNDLPSGQYILLSNDAARMINKKFTVAR